MTNIVSKMEDDQLYFSHNHFLIFLPRLKLFFSLNLLSAASNSLFFYSNFISSPSFSSLKKSSLPLRSFNSDKCFFFAVFKAPSAIYFCFRTYFRLFVEFDEILIGYSLSKLSFAYLLKSLNSLRF